jgi:hypothetical protein
MSARPAPDARPHAPRDLPSAYYEWYAQRLDAVRDEYAAHKAYAATLKAAMEHGVALADAMDRKCVRIRYGKCVFEEETGAFRELLERVLVRRERCRTGAARLRSVLDALVNARVDRTFEAMLHDEGERSNVMTLYFGWKFGGGAVRLAPCPWMRMGDVAALWGFAAHLASALDASDAVCTHLDSWQHFNVDDAIAEHRRHVEALREAVRHYAARYIQQAWLRARDAPGYALWRRRMLREFGELSATLA